MEVICRSESPFGDDSVQVEVCVRGIKVSAESDRGYFHAFCTVRRELENYGERPCCFAAYENVYPSPMIESMGNGEKAFRLTMGQPARTNDIVDIFDVTKEGRPVTVDQQKKFYEEWLESL